MLCLRAFVIVAGAAQASSFAQQAVPYAPDSHHLAGSITPIVIGDIAPDDNFTQYHLIPPKPVTPVEGAIIATNGNLAKVTFSWIIPTHPAEEKIFIEVIAIDNNKIQEVFSGYVSDLFKTIALDAKFTNYAWRLYAVRGDVSQYAVTDWESFSLITRQQK
jgi:hypothetical protein